MKERWSVEINSRGDVVSAVVDKRGDLERKRQPPGQQLVKVDASNEEEAKRFAKRQLQAKKAPFPGGGRQMLVSVRHPIARDRDQMRQVSSYLPSGNVTLVATDENEDVIGVYVGNSIGGRHEPGLTGKPIERRLCVSISAADRDEVISGFLKRIKDLGYFETTAEQLSKYEKEHFD